MNLVYLALFPLALVIQLFHLLRVKDCTKYHASFILNFKCLALIAVLSSDFFRVLGQASREELFASVALHFHVACALVEALDVVLAEGSHDSLDHNI